MVDLPDEVITMPLADIRPDPDKGLTMRLRYLLMIKALLETEK